MSFECAVCYTDGQAGIVTPTCCSHKICLTCYTNIVINNPSNPLCPQCRAEYIKKEELIQTPPLASQSLPLAGQAPPLDITVEEDLENLIYSYINPSLARSIDPFREVVSLLVENRFIRDSEREPAIREPNVMGPNVMGPDLRDPRTRAPLLSRALLINEPLLFVEPLLMTNTFYVGR